jgi:dTDP-4-dehydrorhamnose 3,5-epimerase-like enzyme
MGLLDCREPSLLEGGLGIDDRGQVGFVNSFNFEGVKRFYSVCNHRQHFVRAWHAHRREAKYVTVVCGSALVCAVPIDNWEVPARDATLYRFALSANKPSVLFIPAGYANGFMSLSQDAKLMFFSTSTVDESKADDIRYDARYWDPWAIIER